MITIDGHALVIQLESQRRGFDAQCTTLEPACSHLFRDVIEYLDIVFDSCGIVRRNYENATQRSALNNILGIRIGKLRSRPS